MNDTEVIKPAKVPSFAAAVMALGVGESCSKVQALPDKMKVVDLRAWMPKARQMLRNATAPATARAQQTTGNLYGVQVGEAVMPNGAIFIVAVVTRTE